MKFTLSTIENKKLEELSAPYFKGRVGIYPRFLHLVLSNKEMESLKNKIKNGKQLSKEEQDILVHKYIIDQKQYRKVCQVLANWGGLNGEMLFIDSIGTDISDGIYYIDPKDLDKITNAMAQLTADEAKSQKLNLMCNILKMTPEEYEKYKEKQDEEMENF